jgi:iron complex outermembrane receptor protein
MTLDALYAYLEGTRKEAQMQAIGLSRAGVGKPQTIIRDGVVENGNLVYATMDNVDLRTQSAYDELNTEFKQFTLSGKRHFGSTAADRRLGRLRGLDLHPAGLDDRHLRPGQQRRATSTISGAVARRRSTWASTRPTRPTGRRSTARRKSASARPSSRTSSRPPRSMASGRANPNLKIKAGIDWRKFEYDSYGQYRASETVSQTLTAAELASVSKVFSGFGKGLDMPAGNATAWLVPDIDKYAALLNIYSNTGIYALTETNNTSARGQYGAVEEERSRRLCQAEFRFEAFGLPFRGDAGVRHVKTKQESAGYAAVGGVIQKVEVKREYDLTLPSFNMAADLTDTWWPASAPPRRSPVRASARCPPAATSRCRAPTAPSARATRIWTRPSPRTSTCRWNGTRPRARCWPAASSSSDRHLRRHAAATRRSTTPWACRTRC